MEDGVINTKPSSRHISDVDWKILWARSAGRCQFPGCNKVLYRAPITQQLTITAEQAHIVAFSDDGPRGNTDIDENGLNRHSNLLLLCHDHHHNIDDGILQKGYSVKLLREWKAAHEDRVERATDVTEAMQTHVITYVASISNDIPAITEQEVRSAMHPFRFPSESGPIQFGPGNRSECRDYEGQAFWLGECQNLERSAAKFKERVKDDRTQHFSVFAIAPQPLLIFLGTLLPELKGVDVYQRHKYPAPTWRWPDPPPLAQAIDISVPERRDGQPALLLEFSSKVRSERILKVVPNADIFKLCVPRPAYDCLVSRGQLDQFHRQARELLEEIKRDYGDTTPLHIFPVGPVSISIELGKVRAPKSDTTWYLYDQVSEKTGFERILQLSVEGVQGC